ncbi:MAG: diaminopimelate decarboxylase [Desulfobacula sp.]|uniref:diaminopimelate decarboxylase family protein n=1 Tax=Desulfobacula sp. TaxID=2593537 RepID=UPI001D57EFE5|nr:diaminopimelate decarboxylase [Desulfobacula sp.]MBT3484500.1 diaminopimelate decarboxylase [Desulfobacula sp.]MBT3803138.1 diaminopimelate decarboxylase [Desulfobacula sp.]MBT4024708.1 diaminopimelate decarboxylase [Desulfobacula sp.]MBT4197186.1 diaminopimelate decarboxylase [Desulfobacula sp.]
MKNYPYNVQGLDLHDVCAQFGTPLYVYDAGVIKQQFKNFTKAFSGIDHEIMFAVKSCTNMSIMKYMLTLGAGIDTVSIPEIKMGLKLGFKPEKIVFTPNVVEFCEIRDAVGFGVAINIENLQNLEAFGRKFQNTYPVCIRLNPNMISEIETRTTDLSSLNFASVNKEHYDDVSKEQVEAWHNQSKFGISLTQFDKVLKLVEKYNIKINGVHVHSSHVILNEEVFKKGVKTVFKIAKLFNHLEYVDFGGGIMVKHHPDDKVVELDKIGKILKKEYDKFCVSIGKKIKIWFEPGRYLLSESGILLAKAVVLKTNGFINFVGTNTGFNHLLRPMMYDAYHQIINITNPDGELEKYNIVGNLCEIDNIGVHRTLNKVRQDDIIMIKNAGAYGFSMSSNYNTRPKPAEVLIINGKPRLIRKRENFDDLIRNQIELDF